MNSLAIDEIILAAICCAPFALIGVACAYVVLSGELCEEGDGE